MSPIKDPVAEAMALFEQDYSCSQSLLMAYAPLLELEPAIAARIAAPFAGGMGRSGYTCGAVSGALMVIGLQVAAVPPYDEEMKQQLYAQVREFIARFQEKHGTVICRELVGYDISTPEGLEKARAEGIFDDRCPKFVRDAAEIVGQILDWDEPESSES